MARVEDGSETASWRKWSDQESVAEVSRDRYQRSIAGRGGGVNVERHKHSHVIVNDEPRGLVVERVNDLVISITAILLAQSSV
jgi:hypothetical protein